MVPELIPVAFLLLATAPVSCNKIVGDEGVEERRNSKQRQLRMKPLQRTAAAAAAAMNDDEDSGDESAMAV